MVFNPDDDDFEHQLDLRMVCTLSTWVVFISVYAFTQILNGETPNYPELVCLLQHRDISPAVLLLSHFNFTFTNTGLKTFLKLNVFLLPFSLQACVDPSTKDDLHMVEVEGQDAEGQKVKAALVSLKPSTLPSVSKCGQKEHHISVV